MPGPVISEVVNLYEYCAKMNAVVDLNDEVTEVLAAMGEEVTATQMGEKVQKLVREKRERLERLCEHDDPEDFKCSGDFVFPIPCRDSAALVAISDVEWDLLHDHGFGGTEEVDMTREDAIEAIKRVISNLYSMWYDSGYFANRRLNELQDIVPERDRGEIDRKAAREMRVVQSEFANVRSI